MSMPTFESGIAAGLIAKFGWLKAFTMCAALAGAALMAVFRPPLNRKEMFMQAAVALGCSFLFGDTLTHLLDGWFDFIDFKTSTWEMWMQFSITVHAIVGAMSWGIFGGLAHLRDKVAADPIQAAKDVKSIL